MAIEYGLELGAPATAPDVADRLADLAVSAGLTTATTRFDGEGPRLPSGLLVAARSVRPLPFPDPVEEAFGITPTVHVLFRFDKFADFARQRHDMITLVTGVLTVDAILTFAGEIVWLIRRAGVLTVSSRDDLWPADLLALLPPPYERASFPVL